MLIAPIRHLHVRYALAGATLVLFVLTSGCSHQDTAAKSVPAFQLTQVGIEGPYQHQYRIDCPAVPAYINQYGIPGWIAGLSDNRLIDDGDASSPHSLGLRVCDMFLWYYLRDVNHSIVVSDFTSVSERDAVIQRAITELKKREKRA